MLLPLLAFGTIILATRPHRKLSASLAVTAVGIAFCGAIFLLVRHWQLPSPLSHGFSWLMTGDASISFGFRIDSLSLLMLTVVCAISLLVQIYSLGYMAGDPGFSRYFAFMSLFLWAMVTLVLADSMFQLFIFWELVGLSSYLLIGFWHEKFSASTAGKKAFVMTRLGDVAFLMGLLLVFTHLGHLDITRLNSGHAVTQMSDGLLTVAILLIFGGIIGKSAQFPLMTWLPDAMEGPTPVSALLHSATMVAAGVFMFARLFPFFSLSTTAMTVILVVGAVSMFLAATMAMVSRDIKQVWAYSTISQLGFMIMALAAGGYVAGVWHLTTHAGFKALLFLCSGIFIHHIGSNDLYEIGRHAGKKMLLPSVALTVAAAALAGLPPFSGFFSKELVLAQLATQAHPFWLGLGLFSAWLTAYYAFRVVFLVWHAPQIETPAVPESPHLEDSHNGINSNLMAGPVALLALVALFLGFGEHAVKTFLARMFVTPLNDAGTVHGWLLYAALGAAVCGVVLAWWEFGRARARQVGFVERIQPLHTLFAKRWYIDHVYRLLLERVLYGGFSAMCDHCDRTLIDDSLDGIGKKALGWGRKLSHWHFGMLQHKLLMLFAVVILLSLYVVL